MHISEGVLPAWEIAVGWGFSSLGLIWGLRKLEGEKIVLTALLTSLFFVASLIHVPVGISSAHLVFNGFLGLLLCEAVFPAIFVGLLLQAILFQFGGLLVLGVNTFNMAFPALLSCLFFRKWILSEGIKFYAGAFLSAFVAIFGSGLLISLELSLIGEHFLTDAGLILLIHLPIAAVEGVIYIFLLRFIKKVYPNILEDGK